MRVGRWVAASVAVMALASCGGGTDQASPATSTTTTTAAGPQLTVNQVASVIAETQSDLQEAIGEISSDCFLLDDPTCTGVAGLTYLRLNIQLETLQLKLGGIADPEAKTYVGAVPGEISDLYDRTMADAAELQGHLQTFVDVCPGAAGGGGSAECDDLNAAIQASASTMSSTLDAWGPYL